MKSGFYVLTILFIYIVMSTPIYLRKEIPHHPKSDHKITRRG